MGLFSKLVGDNKEAKAALGFLKGVVEDAVGEAAKFAGEAKAPSETANQNGTADNRSAVGSRYDSVPAEENQYNFSGTWMQYFEKVLNEDWSEYEIRQEEGSDRRCPLFVFYDGGKKALVIEMKTERSSAQRIKRQCAAEGVPYLRFYYDHEGWWNTRSYIRARISRTLSER